MLPQGSWFPYDFGFVPSTLADDGDPLDVLVFMDTSAPVGCVLTVRLIGVIEAKQRRPTLLDEIEAFFETYNALKGKEFKPIDRAGPKRRKLLDEAAAAFQRQNGQPT